MSIESIKERIAELERQKAEIETQIRDTYRSLYAEEEARDRAKKLTPKMIEVLKAMAGGAELVESNWNRGRWWLHGDGELPDVRASVADGLVERRIVERGGRHRDAHTRAYPLTDWGREVAAKLKDGQQ